MRYNLLAGFLTIFLSGAQAFHWPHWGRCPNLTVEQDFSITDYMGTWYTQAAYEIDWIQGKGRCGQTAYSYNSSRDIVKVTNKQISASSNKWDSINGTAVQVGVSNEEAKFKLTLYTKNWGKVTGPYWVLGTDYETYSVVYGCENFLFFFHYYSVWVLSRDQTFDYTEEEEWFYNNVKKVLGSNNMKLSNFEAVDQSNCNV